MPPPYFLLRDSMKKRTEQKYPTVPTASRYAVNIIGLQKNMWKPTEDMKNKELAIKGGALLCGTQKLKFECVELSQPFRLSAEDLLSKYPAEPKDEDLITPIYGRPLRWRRDRVFYMPERWNYFACLPPFGVEYDLESGDFEIFDYYGSGNPSAWQLLWLRFRVWRLRRKIRKELRQK